MANIVLLGPDSWATNYKIVPSVASNNLTVALKTASGADPSVSNPIMVRIGDTERLITSALSVTKNAGTNWCNAGSAELATKEVDFFVYLGYNATDGVVIGFSRIPYATLYSDFSATTTNEKYAGISTITNATAGDNYVNIGRFAATLSAGAGYTWSVPTFTSANLVQRPTYETEWKYWIPTVSGFSSVPTNTIYLYKIIGKDVMFRIRELTAGTSNANTFTYTAPFTAQTLTNGIWNFIATGTDNGTVIGASLQLSSNSATITCFPTLYSSGSTSWTASGTKRIGYGSGQYPIG